MLNHSFNDLKPEVDTLLRSYLRHNGNYRSNALLHSAYVAAADPPAATTWLLDLASVAHDPSAVLADVVDARWIPLAQRAPIYQRILDAKREAVLKSEGLQRESAQQDLLSWQVRWIKYLVATKQYAVAGDAIASLSAATPKSMLVAQAAAIVPLELQVAAQLGTLDSKIAAYKADPSTAPGPEILRSAARQLLEDGDKQSARKILEFVFARELEEHRLVAANFLGLAEIRIANGDTSAAVELLRRLVVVVGNPFENLEPAAALLEKTGRNAEAVEFLEQLVKAFPWEPSYRVRLARAKVAAKQDAESARRELASVSSSADVLYRVRTEAALALAGSTPQGESHPDLLRKDLGSKELNLLATGPQRGLCLGGGPALLLSGSTGRSAECERCASQNSTSEQRTGRHSGR